MPGLRTEVRGRRRQAGKDGDTSAKALASRITCGFMGLDIGLLLLG